MSDKPLLLSVLLPVEPSAACLRLLVCHSIQSRTGEQLALALAAAGEVDAWGDVREATGPDAEHAMCMRPIVEARCLRDRRRPCARKCRRKSAGTGFEDEG